jgi:hypothetical protein
MNYADYFNLYLCFVRKKSRPAPAGDTAIDSEASVNASSGTSVTKPVTKVNKKGLPVLANNVVSMRLLDLASQVPAKTHYPGAKKLHNSRLSLSKCFALMSFVEYGKQMPVEKVRDSTHRLILLQSVALYCLSQEQLDMILEGDPDERNAYLIGLAKNAQQIIKYGLGGTVNNYVGEKVLTPRDVYLSDEIKIHLGLVNENSKKAFMDM